MERDAPAASVTSPSTPLGGAEVVCDTRCMAVAADVQVRAFRAEDAPRVVALRRRITPGFGATPAGLLHALATEPERARARRWAAEAGGEIVGVAYARFAWATEHDDVANVWVGVAPERRRAGLGARLYELAERYLVESGARNLETWVSGDPAGARFLERRGFSATRSARLWSVDPRTVDVTALAELERRHEAEGFRLAPLRTVRELERELYRLFTESLADIPADHPETNVHFDEWRRGMLEHPDLSVDGSFVALDGQRPVSAAWLGVDLEGGLASHWMTGTLRDYRRRGLARLVKLAALGWAAENGITAVYTGNDSTNADMLALNEHLGFRDSIESTVYAKAL
jgi:GNAT superfamily N-acetyltransferase